MEKTLPHELPGGLGLRALGGLGFPTGNQTCKLAHSSGSYFLTRTKAMLDRLVTPTDARANKLMP